MKSAEWVATQPLKAAGLYGMYQVFKEGFSKYGSPEAGHSLLLSGLTGTAAPLASRGMSAGIIEGNDFKGMIGGYIVGAPVDALTGYEMIQHFPQISHEITTVFPGSEHMLGGAAPFLIAFAGRNLVSHLVADVAGLPFRERPRR